MSPKLPSTLRQESGDRCVASVVGGYTKFFLFIKTNLIFCYPSLDKQREQREQYT